MKFKIERGVELPADRRTKYPFHDMKAGDSFAFDDSEKRLVCAAASFYGKKHDMKFTTRGMRCWRIA
jgi:hypothetical protein